MTGRSSRFVRAVVTAVIAVPLLSACSSADVSAEGTWGTGGEGEPQLVLESGGALTGTDGCNRLMGSWEQTDEAVTFIEVASTMMFCEGVDTWLSQLDTGVIDGSTLHISDASGTEIGTLSRNS